MKKIKRILALLLVIFLIAMVFVTLYCAVTGSPYFMASLFVMLGLPLLIYAYMFIYRIIKMKNKKMNDIFKNLLDNYLLISYHINNKNYYYYKMVTKGNYLYMDTIV